MVDISFFDIYSLLVSFIIIHFDHPPDCKIRLCRTSFAPHAAQYFIEIRLNELTLFCLGCAGQQKLAFNCFRLH